MGLSIADLALIDVGMAIDMMIEGGNDGSEYAYKATQEDFDRF